jgi:hypothetical protein
MANAPLIETGWREVIKMICPTRLEEYFCEGDWTTQITLNRLDKLGFARTRLAKP